MKASTHALFGVALVIPFYKLFPTLQDYASFLFGLAITAFGAIIPDVDHPSNPGLVSLLSKHRGWIHK